MEPARTLVPPGPAVEDGCMAQRASHATAGLIALLAILGASAALLYFIPGSEVSADGAAFDRGAPADDRPSVALAGIGEVGTELPESPGDARTALSGAAAAPQLPATVGWTGIVTDRNTGRPIEGAEVTLVAGDCRVAGTTDPRGRVHLEWPVDTAAQLEVDHPGHVGARRPAVELGVELEIALAPSGGIDGSLAGDVLGVAGTVVRLWSFAGSRYRGEPEFVVEADAAGRFTFDDLEPGDYAVGVAHAHAPLLFETGVFVVEGERTELALTLNSGTVLAGRVQIAGTPEPIAGASVSVRPQRQGASESVEELATRVATTGVDGRFQVWGLTVGPAELVIRAPWGARLRARLDLSAAEPDAERTFQISAPASLAGQVVTADGTPAALAHVSIAREADARGLEWAEVLPADGKETGVLVTTCDGSGMFAFEAVPSGTMLLLAAYPAGERSDASQPVFQRIRLTPREARANIIITLAAGLPIGGVVTDPDGTPIDGVSVAVEARSGRSWSEWGTATTDAGGRFQAGPVPAGSALLTLEKIGFERARVRVTVDAQGTTPDEFELVPAISLSGWLVDRYGFAVRGGGVVASSTPPSPGARPTTRFDRADEYGRFEFERLFPGEWTLKPWASGWVSANPNPVLVHVPEDSFRVLEMEPAPRIERSSVTGELVLRGTGAAVEGLRFNGVNGGSVAIEGTRFRVTGMASGRARIIARAKGLESVYFDAVDLAPGVQLDLGRREVRRTSAVEVAVVDKQGRALTRARVYLFILPAEKGGWGHGDRVIRLRRRSGGTYRHESVARYAWRLRVTHAGKQVWSKVVRIAKVRERIRVVMQTARK